MNAKAVSHISAVYRHKCDICGETLVEECNLTYLHAAPTPVVPYGWFLVADKLVCLAHQIEFNVDGNSIL